ncbi:MAG: hypothetical protein ACT4OS_04025, partial [Acidimicrobiales bacterium]
HQLATGDPKNLGGNLTALGLDVAGALLPGATGLGAASRARRAVSGADELGGVARTAAQTTRCGVGGWIERHQARGALTGEAGAVRFPGGGSRFTTDQDALVQLAKSAKRTGVDPTDARTLLDWADEYGLPGRGPEIHPGRPWGQFPYIHIGPISHIPVL